MSSKTAFTRIPGEPHKECDPAKEICCPQNSMLNATPPLPDPGDGSSWGKCFKKRLVFIDFDDTLIDGNLDSVIQSLIKPQELCKLKKESNWLKKMNEVHKIIQRDRGKHAPECVKAIIETIKPSPGMIRLIQGLKRCGDCDLVLISAGTEYFIRQWLRCKNIECCFNKIYALPGKYDDKGLFKICPYHIKTNCPFCPINICKGRIMKEFIQAQCKDNINYKHICYIGDGCNDYCPIQKLPEQNFAYVRACYTLDKSLRCNKNLVVRCPIIRWKHATLVLEHIVQLLRLDLNLDYVRHYFGKSSLKPFCKHLHSVYFRSLKSKCRKCVGLQWNGEEFVKMRGIPVDGEEEVD